MAGRLIHMPMTNTPANHAIHRTVGPGAEARASLARPCRARAAPGPPAGDGER